MGSPFSAGPFLGLDMKTRCILISIVLGSLCLALFIGTRSSIQAYMQKRSSRHADISAACQAQYAIEPHRPALARMQKAGDRHYWDLQIDYVGDRRHSMYFHVRSEPAVRALSVLAPGDSVNLKSAASHGPFSLESSYGWSLLRAGQNVQADVLYPTQAPSSVTQDLRGTVGGWRHTRATIHAVDIDIPLGTDVLAPADGFVEFAESRYPDTACKSIQAATLGNEIVIHTGRGYDIRLAHLRQNSLRVRVGQFVHAGDVIAQSGASGAAYKPHLHIQAEAIGADGVATLPIRFHTRQSEPVAYRLGQTICLSCAASARQ
jgi:hypothetical protein